MVAWYILESPKYSQHRHWGFVKGQFKNELVIVLFPLKNVNQSVGSCGGDRLDCARWNSSWSLFIWIELCLPSKYGRTISLYLPYPRLLIPSYSKMNIGTYLTIELWLKKHVSCANLLKYYWIHIFLTLRTIEISWMFVYWELLSLLFWWGQDKHVSCIHQNNKRPTLILMNTYLFNTKNYWNLLIFCLSGALEFAFFGVARLMALQLSD